MTAKRVLYIDVLRVIASVAVVLLHISAEVVVSSRNIAPFSLLDIGNIVDASTRWCVPIFVMISGAFMLQPERHTNYWGFFKKRIGKAIIPFLFWSLFYLFVRIAVALLKGSGAFFSLKIALSVLFVPAYYHLWFFYLIIGLYISTPVLVVLIKNTSIKEQLFFVAMCVTSLFVNFFYAILVVCGYNVRNIYGLYLFSGHTIYYLLGYYFYKYEISEFCIRLLHTLGVFGWIATIFCSALWIQVGKEGFPFYDYLSPNVFFMTISIFLLVKKHRNKISNLGVLNFMSDNSLGLYMMHPFFLSVLNLFGINGNYLHPIIGIPATLLICLSLCYIISFFLRRNRFLIHLVP